jgi:hypothetical protein
VNRALHPLKKQVIEIAAPKAQNMKARGKREARRPWFINMRRSGLKGRNILRVLRPFRAGWNFDLRTRGDALCACPWLSYLAPLALHHITFISRAFGAALHHIPRHWRCITSLSYLAPLALHYITFIFRALGAALHHFHISRPWRCITSLSYSAPLALHYITFIFRALGAALPYVDHHFVAGYAAQTQAYQYIAGIRKLVR